MANPLALFIKPPYDTWALVHGYGRDDTPPAGPSVHEYVRLRTAGDGDLFAAADGRLSLRPPANGIDDPTSELTFSQILTSSEKINLFLHLSPLVSGRVEFREKARSINWIDGFAYLNVETASLVTALAELLDRAVLSTDPFNRNQVLGLFLQGELDIPVKSGHRIGKAAKNGGGGDREVGFTFLTSLGPFDPAYGYDWLRDFLADGQPALDAFLQLIPKRWPVIDPSISQAEAIQLTAEDIYTMPILEQLRRDHSLTDEEWRGVGNNQKQTMRRRLLRRTGHADPTNAEPPFEFNDLDWRNVFQLESLVEFYANLDDPWATGATPREPADPDYVVVDFLNPSGSAATATGNVVTLDGTTDLERVRTGKDTIELKLDTARPNKLYLILTKDVQARTITLDAAPNLNGNPTSWQINLRPFLIVIDSFGVREGAKAGARLAGQSAAIQNTTTSADGVEESVITLDGSPNLSRVNRNFDTVYLPSDTTSARRTYRIIAVDNETDSKTVTVEGIPSFTGGTSHWQIPAGVSGETPALSYDLGPGSTQGYDHYDGVLFVVHRGVVTLRIRWSSYTSRNYTPFDPPVPQPPSPDAINQLLSSIRGNRRYIYSSFKSPGNDFINYAMAVVDPAGNNDVVPAAYDGVKQARFYFRAKVTDDSTDTDPNGLGPGKTAIRLHYGSKVSNKGSGSAGCLVSPDFSALRDEVIRIYQAEYAAWHGLGSRDNQVEKAFRKSLDKSIELFKDGSGSGLDDTGWNNKMTGVLWLIRPDERPLG